MAKQFRFSSNSSITVWRLDALRLELKGYAWASFEGSIKCQICEVDKRYLASESVLDITIFVVRSMLRLDECPSLRMPSKCVGMVLRWYSVRDCILMAIPDLLDSAFESCHTSTLGVPWTVTYRIIGGMTGSIGLNGRFEEAVKAILGDVQYAEICQSKGCKTAVEHFDQEKKTLFSHDTTANLGIWFAQCDLIDPDNNVQENYWHMK